MYAVWVVLCAAALAGAQYSAEGGIEPRSVAYPSKQQGLAGLFAGYGGGGGGGSQGYRDNSYEDNAVTPSPSPNPVYRPGSQQQVSRAYPMRLRALLLSCTSLQ